MAYNNPITTMLAVGVNLTAGETVTVSDDTDPGGRLVALPAGWWRCFLVNADDADGSEGSPYCLLKTLEGLLGGQFIFDLSTIGLIKVRYTGTVTGGLSFTTFTIAYLLGFTAPNLGGTFTTGQTRTATHAPYGTIYSWSRLSDKGWQRVNGLNAYADMGNGFVYGWDDSYMRHQRSFDLSFLPTNQTYRTEQSNSATPLYPDDKSAWAQARVVPGVTYSPPFTVSHFKVAAKGRIVAMAIYDVQALISYNSTDYDIVYMTSKCLLASESEEYTIKNHPKLSNWKGLQFWLYGNGSRVL